jgi:acyl-CoA synthetase (AMP-forming)/AMP-acid ligase II/acyl carrier protein
MPGSLIRAPREQIVAYIQAYIGRMLDLSDAEVLTNVEFASYGLTSSSGMSLLATLEEELDRELSPALLYEYPTIDAFTEHLASAITGGGDGSLALTTLTPSRAPFDPRRPSADQACRTLLDLLDYRAESTPERVAFKYLNGRGEEVEQLTYAQLRTSARRLAAQLQNERGLRPGERVVLLTSPSLSFLVAFFACQCAQLIPVTCVTPRNRQGLQKLHGIVSSAEPTLLLMDVAASPQLAKLLADDPVLGALQLHAFDYVNDAGALLPGASRAQPEDVAFIQYTSGSTSQPKGVVLTHANLMANERMLTVAMESDERSTWVSWTPLHHDQGLIGGALHPFYTGALCVLMSPSNFALHPMIWLQAIDRYRARVSGGPDFAFELCAKRAKPDVVARLDLSCWQVAFNGADTIRPESLALFSERFAACGFRREAFFNCYGLAEASVFVAGGPMLRPPVIESLGSVLAGPDELARHGYKSDKLIVGCGEAAVDERLIIVEPSTRTLLDHGCVGEIWVSGLNVARRYWNNEHASEALNARLASTGRVALDGSARSILLEQRFLRTGDLGVLRDDGQLFVCGRIKDLMIVEGRNHHPQDLERTVQRSSERFTGGATAAFAYDGDERQLLAIVQELDRPPASTQELRELERLVRRVTAEAHDLAIDRVLFVRKATLPKTSSGKLQRGLVRQRMESGELLLVTPPTTELNDAHASSNLGSSL